MILASASPRRKFLLESAGFSFTVQVAKIDEKAHPALPPDELVCLLAKRKGDAVAATLETPELVVSSDTIVYFDGRILEKPESTEDAYRMLKLLSGNTHTVYTSVQLKYGEHAHVFYDTTEVEFFELTQQDLDYYIATGDPFDKAGAYGIQGRGTILVKQIRGNYETVMGLPVARIYRELITFMRTYNLPLEHELPQAHLSKEQQ